MARLEIAVGQPEAARAARRQATNAYLAYRCGGGQSQSELIPIFDGVAQAVSDDQRDDAARALEEAVGLELAPWLSAPLRIAQAFLAGNRDPGLVDDPDIDPIDVVELLLLLEALDGRSPAGSRAIGDG